MPPPTSAPSGEVERSEVTRSRELDGHFVKGVAWTGAARLASQVVSWASFLALARILLPSDFGIIAGATAVVGFVALIAEFGLGTAIVAKKEISDIEIRQLAGVAAITGVVAWAVSALLGWPTAKAMRIPELVQVLPLVGVTIGLSTFNAVPIALMRRHMHFRRLSQLEMVKVISAALMTVALALAGFGFWAPLTSELLAGLAMSALLLRETRVRPQQPQWSRISDTVNLSREVLLSRAAWYAYSNADFAVVSRRLGKSVLGDYSMAWTLINLPTEKVATLIFSVTPSIFARVREDLPEFRRYVLLLFESMALLLMPMSAGIGLVAPDAVAVVLGPKWQNATPLIQALALFAVVKSVSPLSAQILISRGKAAAARRQSLIGLAVLPIAFLLASRYGAVAVALVWTTLFPILVAFQINESTREIELPLGTLAKRLAPITLATLVMAAAVFGTRTLMSAETMAPALRLAASVTVGAAVYVAVLSVLAMDRLKAAVTFIRTRR